MGDFVMPLNVSRMPHDWFDTNAVGSDAECKRCGSDRRELGFTASAQEEVCYKYRAQESFGWTWYPPLCVEKDVA